jgi:hypothetical protein
MFIPKKMDRVFVEPHGQTSQERNVVSQNFLIVEVKGVSDDRIHVIVGEQKPNGGLSVDVVEEKHKRLQQLRVNKGAWTLQKNGIEVSYHVLFQEVVEYLRNDV